MNRVELHPRNHVWSGHSRGRSRLVKRRRSHDRNRERNNRKFSNRRRNVKSDSDLRRKRKPGMGHRRNQPRSRKASQVAAVKARERNRKNSDE